jgi:hypothetical protein
MAFHVHALLFRHRMAVHLALLEAGVPYQLELVDFSGGSGGVRNTCASTRWAGCRRC